MQTRSVSFLPSCTAFSHSHRTGTRRGDRYLGDHVGRFPEVLTPADAGAGQEVLDQTHADVVTPKKTDGEDGQRARDEDDSDETEVRSLIFGGHTLGMWR